MRISDWSSDVCSSDLLCNMGGVANTLKVAAIAEASGIASYGGTMLDSSIGTAAALHVYATLPTMPFGCELLGPWVLADTLTRSEEHTSELQSLMRISYAVFCLKKKQKKQNLY